MSTLSLELRSLFIHVPKCAGTSMERGPKWNEGAGHDTLFDFQDKVNLDSVIKWAFVRNPWTRLESFYVDSPEARELAGGFERFVDFLHECRDSLDPDDFSWTDVRGDGILDRIHIYSQFSMLSIGGEMKLDFVGHFESLERDWKSVCDLLGVEHSPLPHHRKRAAGSQVDWTPGMRKKVMEIYPRDFWS